MLELKDVRVAYGNIEVKDGEIVTIIGANGAGKTTTLRSTAGLLPKKKDSSIIFDGKDITNMGAELGATTSIFPSDEVTHAFLKAQGREEDYMPLAADADAVYDEVIPVADDDAFATGRLIGRSEGVLVGISSGAALWAGIELAKRPENKGKTIVVLLPDTGDRYLSTPLFQD